MSNAFADLAQDYFDTVRSRYQEFRENVGQDQTAVMRYYTFGGDEVRVGNVQLQRGSGTILIQGDVISVDEEKVSCDVIVQPPGAQLVLKILTLRDTPPEDEVRFEQTESPSENGTQRDV